MVKLSRPRNVSGVFTSPFLDTDDLKMAFRAGKVSGAFEKQAPETFRARKAMCLKTEKCIRQKLFV